MSPAGPIGVGEGRGVTLAYLQLAASMALVGANVAVAKVLSDSLPIAMIAGLRCLLASALLLPLAARWDGLRLPSRPMLWNLFWQAAFGTALYNAGLLAGLRLTTALEGGLVLATLPAVVALGGAIFLRERLSPRAAAAALIAALGMGTVVLARNAPDAGGSLAGNALVFLGVIGEAAYVLLAKRAGGVPVLTAALLMQVFSAFLLLPFWLPHATAIARLADPHLLGLLVFHSVTSSILCLLLWYAGLRRVPASRAGVFTTFLPATAAVTAVLFLGEAFTATHAAGFVLMLASILLATWPSRRA
ncbi:DMT family transporter [Roseomonas sp. CCTCC AB2023176]|uniref:DMT family transporter n=1 Tax=Roseomonas sp. CCTCC AB2023176 TaxID=3342640 RepID=UPI0035DF1624